MYNTSSSQLRATRPVGERFMALIIIGPYYTLKLGQAIATAKTILYPFID